MCFILYFYEARQAAIYMHTKESPVCFKLNAYTSQFDTRARVIVDIMKGHFFVYVIGRDPGPSTYL